MTTDKGEAAARDASSSSPTLPPPSLRGCCRCHRLHRLQQRGDAYKDASLSTTSSLVVAIIIATNASASFVAAGLPRMPRVPQVLRTRDAQEAQNLVRNQSTADGVFF